MAVISKSFCLLGFYDSLLKIFFHLFLPNYSVFMWNKDNNLI